VANVERGDERCIGRKMTRGKMGWRWASGLVGPLLFFDFISSLLHFATGVSGKKKEWGEGKF
jgi:hypothetical protein